MRKIIVFVGSLVVSLLLLGVPALCVTSFILDWDVTLKFFLTALTICECVSALMMLFYYFWFK